MAQTIHNFRRLDANIRHNNAGFTDAEVAQLQKKFHLNEDSDTRRVPCSRARHLMEMVVPKNKSLIPYEKEILEQVIQEAEHDAHGSIEFADFLHFARAVKDARETTEFEEQKMKELREQQEMEALCNEYNISHDLIDQYREVFHK